MFKTILIIILSPFMIGGFVGLAITGCANGIFCHWHDLSGVANIVVRPWEWNPIVYTVLVVSSFLSIKWYAWLCRTNRYEHRTAGHRQSGIGMLVTIPVSVLLCSNALQPRSFGIGSLYSYKEFFTDFSALATTVSIVTFIVYIVFLHFRYRNTVSTKTA